MKTTEKQIMIPEALFLDLVRYHLLGVVKYGPVIEQALNAKLEAIATRELYSRSKTAPTPEEREAARQAYLDQKGIPQDFRWGPEGITHGD